MPAKRRLYATITGDSMPVRTHIDEGELSVEVRFDNGTGKSRLGFRLHVLYPEDADVPFAFVDVLDNRIEVRDDALKVPEHVDHAG